MAKRVNDLGRDSVGRLLARLALPAITAQLINALYNIVDRMYIGHIPGVGKLMVDAIKARNYPLVQGSVLVLAVLQSLVNLVIDILYAFVDPRIRSQYVRKRKKVITALKEGETA